MLVDALYLSWLASAALAVATRAITSERNCAAEDGISSRVNHLVGKSLRFPSKRKIWRWWPGRRRRRREPEMQSRQKVVSTKLF